MLDIHSRAGRQLSAAHEQELAAHFVPYVNDPSSRSLTPFLGQDRAFYGPVADASEL